eukprot:4015638-Prymnesium_polylepis.2
MWHVARVKAREQVNQEPRSCGAPHKPLFFNRRLLVFLQLVVEAMERLAFHQRTLLIGAEAECEAVKVRLGTQRVSRFPLNVTKISDAGIPIGVAPAAATTKRSIHVIILIVPILIPQALGLLLEQPSRAFGC